MNITKDEATILYFLLNDKKWEFNDSLNHESKEAALAGIDALERLEKKLEDGCKDQRRVGRTSQDDYYDVWRRFVKG